MDTGDDALARRAQRFGHAPVNVEDDVVEVDEEARLAELIQLRTAERKEAEQHGIISSGKTRLEEAKDLEGTCPGMISEYQYYWRKLRYNNIHTLEKDEQGRPRWYLTIKDYARSAAGNEQELPSDVRSPDVLLRTTDYILSHILTTYPFTPVNQAFIRDRARAIVKDFTMQHVRNAPAIEAHERIVRMAALSMHIFRDQRQPDGPFDHDGERKQFVNALSSLSQFYTDSRTPTLPKTYISPTHIWPHEAEFTAYWHLFSLRRPPPLPLASPTSTSADEYPNGIHTNPLFRLAQTFISLWTHSETLIKEAENMLLSPKERAAREAREASRGVHRFKRLEQEQEQVQDEEGEDEDEGWRPQRFDYPAGYAFPAHAILRRLADPGVPWVLAAVLEASALDDVRARALWEVWQIRRGGDVLVSELVDLFGCDGAEDVRAIVDAVAEASGRAVRRLRPKGSDEIRAYRLVGSMKFPSHFPRARRNVRLIDSKKPTHVQLADVVNHAWDETTSDYDLTIEDVPDLDFPNRIDIEETDGITPSRVATPAVAGGAFGTGTGTGAGTGAGAGKIFAGFGEVGGAVGKSNPFGAGSGGMNGNGKAQGNPFGGTSSFGGTTASSNPFGGGSSSGPITTATTVANPFGAPSGSKPNPFGGAAPGTNPFGNASTSANPFATASSATPFGATSSSTSTSAPTPFGSKPPTFGTTNGTSNFGAGAGSFGAGSGSGAFNGGATTTAPGPFSAGSGAFGAGSGAFGAKPAAPTPAKVESPPTTKLSPFATSFVPKFKLPGATTTPAQQSSIPAPTFATPIPEVAATPPVTASQDVTAAEAAKAAREAKLKEKIEAAKREEARQRAEEERRAEERRRREEAKKQEMEARQREAEAERQRLEAEQQELEAKHQQEQDEREQRENFKREQQARAVAERREHLHSTTAQLLLGDILEILVVPEVQYVVDREKRNRWLARSAFAWWKTRATKRAKRRQVLENMGLGRVGVAGAAGEVGELFDEEDEEGDEVVYERRRTLSLREHRTDAELATAMAKAAAERERLWASGVFYDVVKQVVMDAVHGQGMTLDDVPGWDIWLCTSGANKSSAEWLRKKFDARPTQLVDGTVSIAAVTPNLTKKDSAPGLVVFECSPYLGAAMNETEWSNAWSNEASRIARLFSAMSNHSSYTPSLLFVVWSTDHVAQHSEAITRKIKKAASHLADVSIQGEPAVAVLVDDTAEQVFEEALASLELDIEGRPLVEQSSVTESLSKQMSSWHRTLSQVLNRIPTFDDEDNAPYLAQAISALLKAFNAMVSGVQKLLSLQPEDTIYLPELSPNTVHDTKSLYNLADSYVASLSFAEAVDLNVVRTTIRQYRHSGKLFPTRFFCERLVQLVDIALTPLVSGNRPRPAVYATEQAFEIALTEATSALDARAKKRTQDGSPVRDNKKARLISTDSPVKPKENGEAESSGAAKLRALLDKTRNRWATDNGGT